MESYFLREQKDRQFMLSNVAYNLGEFNSVDMCDT